MNQIMQIRPLMEPFAVLTYDQPKEPAKPKLTVHKKHRAKPAKLKAKSKTRKSRRK